MTTKSLTIFMPSGDQIDYEVGSYGVSSIEYLAAGNWVSAVFTDGHQCVYVGIPFTVTNIN